MNQETKGRLIPAAVRDLSFDELGQYEVTEITDAEWLNEVGGGATINVIACGPSSNVGYCPSVPPPPPPPPPPKPNANCGEDGDGE